MVLISTQTVFKTINRMPLKLYQDSSLDRNSLFSFKRFTFLQDLSRLHFLWRNGRTLGPSHPRVLGCRLSITVQQQLPAPPLPRTVNITYRCWRWFMDPHALLRHVLFRVRRQSFIVSPLLDKPAVCLLLNRPRITMSGQTVERWNVLCGTAPVSVAEPDRFSSLLTHLSYTASNYIVCKASNKISLVGRLRSWMQE